MDRLFNQMRDVAKKRQDASSLLKESYEDSSKKRLSKILEKKIKTAFIGAISEFEQSFGETWGYNQDIGTLNENEKIERKIWNEVRTKILNLGNNQIRAMKNELAQYTVTWDRYSAILLPLDKFMGLMEQEHVD